MIRRYIGLETAAAILGVAIALGGCSLASQSLNPQFMEVLGTPFAPIAPGTAPFVLIRNINMTDHRVLFRFEWIPAGTLASAASGFNVSAGLDGGILVSCPVSQITLGSLDNPTTAGALVIFDDNTRQEIPPLGRNLREGIDYFCGDVVIFAAVRDSSTVGGYSTIYGVIDGSSQGTEFAGANTFELAEREIGELISSGIESFEQAFVTP
ncbi:MAG TPA: hypothetical protein VMZ31_17725 [Phycisphaerae bacterium]|nr:hypothetical protein [Phycisphaerae bacterium]